MEQVAPADILADQNCQRVLTYINKNMNQDQVILHLGLYTDIKIELKAGQILKSTRKLAILTALTYQECRTALKKLEVYGHITTEGHHFGTITTLINAAPPAKKAIRQPQKTKHNKKQKRTKNMQKKLDIKEVLKAATLVEPYPVDPQEVIKAAELIGYKMTLQDAMLFIANYESTGWIASNGQPIRKWTALLVRWKSNYQSAKFKKHQSTAKPQKGRYTDQTRYGNFRKDGK